MDVMDVRELLFNKKQAMKILSTLRVKKQKSKINSSGFIEMNGEGSVLPQSQEPPFPGSYHRTCKTLPLEAFIQAYCNNDLSGLLISGQATSDALQEAWNEVIFDYSGLIKTKSSDYLFQLAKEIAILNHHVIYVEYTIIYLKEKYHEGFADELKNFGYNVPLFEDEHYQPALDRITCLATSKVFELQNLQDEYDRLNKTVEGKNQTEDEFIRTVAMLSKYQGYNIDTLSTTVYRFVMTFNNYLAEMSIIQKQYEKS